MLGGHGEGANDLLESGASINSKDTSCATGDTSLHYAVNIENVGRCGADVDSQGG